MRTRLAPAAVWAVAVLAAACGRKPASVQVSPPKARIYGIERPQRLLARVLDKNGQAIEGAPTVSWSSSHADVAAVDASGRVVSKKEGKTVVTASVEGASGSAAVEVIDVKSVEVAPLSARLVGPPGSSLPLAAVVRNSLDKPVALTVTWTSSDERVARVSDDGVVSSVAAGRVTIVAKLGDLQSAAEVAVDPRPLSRLVLSPATALVRVGDSQHYQIAAYDAAGREIEGAAARYTSSNPAVATVDTSGVAAGVKAGVATIRAQVGNLTTEATVIVN